MTNILKTLVEALEVPGLVIPSTSIYEADERLYVTLSDKRLLEAKSFCDKERIRAIAGMVFDIPHTYEKKGTLAHAIHFEEERTRMPKGMNYDYFKNHQGHLIEVPLNRQHPQLTYWTRNRGSSKLHEIQRKNYFEFLKRVHKAFLEATGISS